MGGGGFFFFFFLIFKKKILGKQGIIHHQLPTYLPCMGEKPPGKICFGGGGGGCFGAVEGGFKKTVIMNI